MTFDVQVCMRNEVYKKVTSSPKFARILRRQKIYAEPTAVLNEHKVSHNDKVEIINGNILLSNNYCTYIDRYSSNTKCLSGFLVNLNVLVQTDYNLLLSNLNTQFEEYYMPFYYKLPNMLFPGVLLDLPQKVTLENFCSDSLLDCKSSAPRKHLNAQIKGSFPLLSTLPENTSKPRICHVDDTIPVSQNVLSDDTEIGIQEDLNIHPDILHIEEFILDPIRLNMITREEERRLELSEHNQLARVIIMYTLAFFMLALVTFFIIYLA